MIYRFALPLRDYSDLLAFTPEHSEAATAFRKAHAIVSGEYFQIDCSQSELVEILAAALEHHEDMANEIMRQLRSQKAPLKLAIEAASSISIPARMKPEPLIPQHNLDLRNGTFG
jgi:hypothetical protein